MTENVVDVKEDSPGLLALAKIQPIDAQHLAQTTYPEGRVQKGEISRRELTRSRPSRG